MSAAPQAATKPPTTENCRFCWMCRHACPVGHVTHRETHTPHAWALTIEAVKRKQLQWNDESTAVLYACADCGLCQAHCATDQPLPDAIVANRADVVAAGLAPAAVLALDRTLQAQSSAYGATVPVARDARAHVALFVGDAGHHLGPRAVSAAERLLEGAGVHAVPVGVGYSSGSVASSLGLRATAERLARAIVSEVESVGATEVLVLTAGDRWTFEHVYPMRLGVTWPKNIMVQEVVTVLADAMAIGRLSFLADMNAPEYAHHEPCHSARIERNDRAPKALLEAALGRPGHKLFWREGRAHPCGATGGLEVTRPDLAARLADARLADAASAGAAWLVTEDPLCLHHLRQRHRDGVEVKSLYELLLERLDE